MPNEKSVRRRNEKKRKKDMTSCCREQNLNILNKNECSFFKITNKISLIPHDLIGAQEKCVKSLFCIFIEIISLLM